jgi:D-alanyl-D-alanine carboxypeptidase
MLAALAVIYLAPAWLADLRKKLDLPGIGAVTVENGLVNAVEVEGTTRTGFNDPIKPEMTWHLGSNTMGFTAALVASFVEEGKLSYDSTVVKVLGLDVKRIEPGYEGVTVRDLLEQRGGVTRETYPGGATWFTDKRPIREQRAEYAQLAFMTPRTDAGRFVYANANYVILGAICEKVGNRSWEELMEKRIFQPLGITSAGYGPNPKGNPQPHKLVDGVFSLLDDDEAKENAPVVYPAGGMYMSLGDYGKWLKAVVEESGPIPKSQWRLLTTPTTLRGSYAGGWLLQKDGERARFMTQFGSNTLNIAGTYIDYEKKRAISIAANGYSDTIAKEIAKTMHEWVTR